MRFGINTVLATNYTAVYIITAIICVFAIVLAIIIGKKRNEPKYIAKDSLLTPTEITYYDTLTEIIGGKYLLFPQINLASVVDKEGKTNARTELFRNIDFGVFDYNFKPILLIEINDNSHTRKDRIERDKKVAKILKKAKLPLVTFWVKDGIDVNAMRAVLARHIKV